MKKVIGVLVALVLAAAAAAGVYYQFVYKKIQENGGRVSSTSEDAIPVESVKAVAGLGSGSGAVPRFAGVVEPQETWTAKLQNDRTVKTTYVKEGDSVKVGDKLFSYDTSEDQDKVEQDEIDLERLQNDIVSTQASIDQLWREKGKASADEQLNYETRILTEENSIKQTQFEIKSKELEISQLKDSIRDADVCSELEGIVKSINNPNSSSSYSDSGNSDEYITIMALGDFRVKGTVNEQNINSIYEGQRMIAFSRVDDSNWEGTVSRIKRDSGEANSGDSGYYGSGSSDSGTNSTNYPFYVKLDNSENLMLGQHVYLEPDEGQTTKKDGIWIPEYYINADENGETWVWAASAANVLERRVVELGDFDDGLSTYEIKNGLDADDYIRTYDDELREGLPVVYVDYTTADTGEYYDDMPYAFADDLEEYEFDEEGSWYYDVDEEGSWYYEDVDDEGSWYYEIEDADGSSYYDEDEDSGGEEENGNSDAADEAAPDGTDDEGLVVVDLGSVGEAIVGNAA